jgi:hypothetical protein
VGESFWGDNRQRMSAAGSLLFIFD